MSLAKKKNNRVKLILRTTVSGRSTVFKAVRNWLALQSRITARALSLYNVMDVIFKKTGALEVPGKPSNSLIAIFFF